MRASRPAVRVVCIALAASLCAARAQTASLFDPALTFRVLRTTHFRIYFHQGGDRLASRLATIAEATWTALERPLGVRPPPLTHVVLADQTDLPNGYATPLPYDTIVIYTTWPPGAEFDVDDWLRLVFTHELTHIVHLDRSEGWARAARAVFGRTLIAFPNVSLPVWQIEGLAVYQESAITGEGRMHAGDFRAITEEAARRSALEPLDRVNGGLTDWPSGQASYAYGLAFHQYLVDRFGADALAKLADATAHRVPYVTSPVFRRVFGESLGDLWRDFESSAAAKAGAPAMDASAARLTHHGFVSAGPRFDRSGCATCAGRILYARRDADGFPTLASIGLDGSAPAELARRYFGSTTAPGRDAIYFDQLEVRRNAGLYGDLFALTRESGRVRQLTSNARLHDPDLSPDETTLVCTRERLGQRDLVLVRPTASADAAAVRRSFTRRRSAGTTTARAMGSDVASGSRRTVAIDVLLSEPETQFSAPRWSPDGHRIAVERHRLGADPEIIVVDAATRAVQVVAHAEKTRFVMPAWRPDGRAIVAAVAPDDRPFNLVELPLDASSTPRQLTHTSGGATWPEISPDGRTLLFVGYTIDGYDVFSMPYPAAESGSRGEIVGRAVPPEFDVNAAPGAPPAAPAQAERAASPQERSSTATPYSPLPTLKPTSWFPIVDSTRTDVRVGATTGGVDVLGYHTYLASATWLVSAPADAIAPSRALPDWSVSYAYGRWRPTLFATASTSTSFFAGPATDAGTPSSATRRELVVEGGVILPFVHSRVSHTALATIFRAADDYSLIDGTLSRRRAAIRGAWQTRTAHTYGYSISQEGGIVAAATAEVVDRALGASADATTITTDVRAFLPGVARHHVIAARFAGGRSVGDAIVGRTFVMGGAASQAGAIDFGSGAASLLRGFAANSFAGSRVALVNLEYRWPIARPQRGVGTWPIFLHTIHAAAFADAGHAWTRSFELSSIKTSIGAELSTNLVAGYYVPVTVTAGAAWGRDGSGTIPSGASAYFRIGKSF